MQENQFLNLRPKSFFKIWGMVNYLRFLENGHQQQIGNVGTWLMMYWWGWGALRKWKSLAIVCSSVITEGKRVLDLLLEAACKPLLQVKDRYKNFFGGLPSTAIVWNFYGREPELSRTLVYCLVFFKKVELQELKSWHIFWGIKSVPWRYIFILKSITISESCIRYHSEQMKELWTKSYLNESWRVNRTK